ncbi:MAG: SEC-C domain-containing protein, partial [Nocardioides sp.]|nr:SEC-C domain-containing protein [Nocardioides sp.]
MAKKSRIRNRQAQTADDGINPRAACPCGSGKRYKACHGSSGGVFVARTFAGLPGECDLVAMRELVPSATVALKIKGYEDVPVTLGTLLPAAAPGMSRDSGQVWAGLQVQHNYGDISRDVAAVLLDALELRAKEESGVVGLPTAPGAGPRLQDIVLDTSIDVVVHKGFDWWLADVEDKSEFEHALEHANESVLPTARL